ncbi:MAG: FKBP-type peptidyl-prolyl cis-trans isomerase [Candidatus Saccharimonadales bacterium]
MLKNRKMVIIGALTIGVIAALGGGFFAWQSAQQDSSQTKSSLSTGATVPLNYENAGGDSISLTPKQNTPKDPNALSVDSSPTTSTNLGSGTTRQQTTNTGSTADTTNFSDYEQYKDKNEVFFGDIVLGKGAEAVKDSKLAVTYKGYLTNGQLFDQSRTGNNGQLEPLLFTLGAGQLIPGFEQGVAGMKAGGTRRVIIPPSLGYGPNAQGSIPANSVLIFDIQLTAAQ